MVRENPCLHCGACCAKYRVSFYWAEAEEALGGSVPLELTEDVTQFLRCMAGTNRNPPRCVALQGEVGGTVRCAIYDRRPSPCREFGLTWENGLLRAGEVERERCNQARAAWGLPPLFRPKRRRGAGSHAARNAPISFQTPPRRAA